MKITLIGASGFVGTRLITLLKKAQRYEMLNIDLQQSRFFPEVTAIGDVRDQDYLDKKLEGAECVVLLAAQHRDDVVPVSLYYDTNVGGIEKTLKAMEKNNIAPEYIQGMLSITSVPMLVVIVAAGLVGGLIGGFIGQKALKKHFIKAGLVSVK